VQSRHSDNQSSDLDDRSQELLRLGVRSESGKGPGANRQGYAPLILGFWLMRHVLRQKPVSIKKAE
jgi:hypothetical protein